MNITSSITRDHITGFAIGIGTSVLAYYLYKTNQDKVEAFLKQKGINLPTNSIKGNLQTLTLEELVTEKERLEDLIAEKEIGYQEK